MISNLKRLIANQKIKFLIVGGYNTSFSFALGNAMYYFLPFHYTVIAILSYIISVLNSYTTYKLFVFKTKGNVLHEIIKANITYISTFFLSLSLMFLSITILKINKVLAFNIVSVVIVTITYFAHNFFTFKNKI